MLNDLLARVIDARERVTPTAGPTPVLLKIAPDLSLPDLDDVVGIARSRRVDGMIVGNTTVTRPNSLHDVEKAKEAGGLSARLLLSPIVCWRRPMCGSRASSRWSAPAASIPAPAHLAKSALAPAWSRSPRALFSAGLPFSRKSRIRLLAALERDRQTSLVDYVGADAASVTAEPWPE